MRILVTGSDSYIGAVLVPMLMTKHRPFSYDLKNGFDICDETTLAAVIDNCDAIIHLAAASTPKFCEDNPDVAQRVNVDAVKIINKLRGDKPIFFPNTNIGYGVKTKQDIYDESSPMDPASVYGKTKCRGEHLILDHGHCVVFRLASLFGCSPSMRWNLLLNFMVKEAYDKGVLELYEPHAKRNFLHVRDICKAFIHALDNYEAMKNQVYNVGLSNHPTKKMMATMIKNKLVGVKITEIEGADMDKRDYIISNDRIIASGWYPDYGIEDGINELITEIERRG